MAKKQKLQVTPELITDNLPAVPSGYHYEVERFSPLVWRVWLVHEQLFSYKSDTVRTIWGFVKSTGEVVRPSTRDKISREKVCRVTDIPTYIKYTTIVP